MVAKLSSKSIGHSPQHVENYIKDVEAHFEALEEVETQMKAIVPGVKAKIEAEEVQDEVDEVEKVLEKPYEDTVRPSAWDSKAAQIVPTELHTQIEPIKCTKSERYALDAQCGRVILDAGADKSELEGSGYEEDLGGTPKNFQLLDTDEVIKVLQSLQRSTSGELDNYVSVQPLVHGGESRVWLLRRKKDEKLLVCKAIPHGLKSISPSLEVQILQGLLPRHDRIIRLRDWFSGSKATQLYFEYFDGGDLDQLSYQYYRRSGKFPESFLWHVFLQLCEAVAFIHYGYDARRQKKHQTTWQKIIHRDIKPANIFLRLPLNYPGKGLYPSLVLADFGMASLHNTSNRIVGTPEFQPPEIPKASRKADVWAVGAVMHSLIHNGQAPVAPMPDSYDGTIEDWHCQPIARKPNKIRGKYSPELAFCVFGALKHDPKERWDIVQLLNTIINSEKRKSCIKGEWKPLADWSFSENPRMSPKSSGSSRASDRRI